MKTKTEARREAILSAARAVFEEVGFEQATMSEITARVGGSKATLYRYFDSKETLFLELVHRSAREHGGELLSLLRRSSGHAGASTESAVLAEAMEAMALLDPNEDVAISLSNFGRRVLKTFHTPQKLAALRMAIAASTNKEIGRLFYDNGPARGKKYIEHYFAAVMKLGKVPKAPAAVVASHFRGLLGSEVHEAGLFNVKTDLSDRQIAAAVRRAVDAFMRAYG